MSKLLNTSGKSKMKFVGKLLAVVVGIILVFLLAVPTVLSTSWGHERLMLMANHRIPGKLSVEEIHLSWFGSQEIKGATLTSPKGSKVVDLEYLLVDRSLLNLLVQGLKKSKVKLENFKAEFFQEENGKSSLQNALGASIIPSSIPLVPVTVKNLNADLHFTNNHTVEGIINGKTEQQAVEGFFNAKATLSLNKKDADIDAVIKNFPVAILDYVLALKDPNFSHLATSAFGKTLDATINGIQTSEGSELTIEANSATFKANLVCFINDEHLGVKQPGSLSLILTPELLTQLAQAKLFPKDIELQKAVPAELVLEELILPFSFFEKHLNFSTSPISANAYLKIAEAEVHGKALKEPLTLKQFQATLKTDKNSDIVNLQLQGNALQHGDPIKVNLNAFIDKPNHFNHLMDSIKEHTTVKADLQNVPVELLDGLVDLKKDISLEDLLGKKISLNSSLYPKNGRKEVQLSITSDKVQVSDLMFSYDSEITLLKPALMQYKLSRKLLPEKLEFNEDPFLELYLQKLSLPLTFFEDPLQKQNFIVDGNLKIKDGKGSYGNLGSFNFKNTHLKILGNVYEDTQIDFGLELLSEKNSIIASTFGDSLKLQLSSLIQYQEDKSWDVNPIKLDVASNLLKGTAKAYLVDHYLTVNEPSLFQYVLTPNALQAFGLAQHELFSLLRPSHIQLKINPIPPISIEDLSLFNFEGLKVTGDVQIDEVALLSKKSNEEVLLQKVVMPWEFNGPTNQISFDCKGMTKIGKLPAEVLQAYIKSSHFLKSGAIDFSESDLYAQIKLNKIPTLLLEAISGQNLIDELIGKSIDIDVAVNMSLKDHQGDAQLYVKAENLNASAGLNINESITLKNSNNPITVNANLNPTQFQALRKLMRETMGTTSPERQLALLEPISIKATITSLSIPQTDGPLVFNGKVSIDKVKVSNYKDQMAFQNVLATIESLDLRKEVKFHISGVENQKGQQHPLFIAGSAENFFNKNYTLNTKELSLNLEAKSQKLPAGLLCELACIDDDIRNKVEALFGDSLDTDIKVKVKKMEGPISALFKGKNGFISLDGQLNNGFLTLNKPFQAEVKVTPQLGESVLQEVIPILGGAISSDQPIKISIDPQGFAIPLTEVEPQNIQLGLATIDLGKITFNDKGQLGTVFDLLKPSSQEVLSVWFTPLYLYMKEGIVFLHRMDLLMLNRYPVAVWGKVNLPKDKVDIKIGLTGIALSHALNIQGLEEDYMMQLALRGKTSDASIDKAKATARISALMAQTQGGTKGAIIGTFLDIAGGGLAEERPPKPTTDPLPWKDQFPQQKQSDTKTHAKKKKESKNVVEEAASSFLNNLLK